MTQPEPHVDHVQAADGETITLHHAVDDGAGQLVLAITDPADQIVSEPRLDPATARSLGSALIAFADNVDRAKLGPVTDGMPADPERVDRPRPTQDELEMFIKFYCSGFISGAATLAGNNGIPNGPAVAIGQHLNAIALNDPAYRHTLGEDLARLWSEGDFVPKETTMDVHAVVAKRGSGS